MNYLAAWARLISYPVEGASPSDIAEAEAARELSHYDTGAYQGPDRK